MFNEKWKRDFLESQGWSDAVETPAGEDWALRRFSRLAKNGQTVVLMQSLPDKDPRATAGHKVRDYVMIGEYLAMSGFPAPKIYAEDVAKGLLLIEDFGSVSLHEKFVEETDDVADLYLAATGILIGFYKNLRVNHMALPDYFETHIYQGRQRIIDWYYPARTGKRVPPGLREKYLAIWNRIEASLPEPVSCFAHADYHPHNLMVRGDGVIGLIDFQGAMWAPGPYDLVNLLEDARRIVPKEIKSACQARFKESISEEEWPSFVKWYVVLATQFHCRVIGQAIRLAVREDKTRLLDYVPVLEHYLSRELQSPVLKELKEFFTECGLDFQREGDLNLSPDLFAADVF